MADNSAFMVTPKKRSLEINPEDRNLTPQVRTRSSEISIPDRPSQ
jgi:hypothetical protein